MPPLIVAIFLSVALWWSIRLMIIDFREHRLPDRLVLPAYPTVFAALLLMHPTDARVLESAAIASILAVAAGFFLNRFAGLGLGDVKLVGVCVAALVGANALAAGLVAIAMVGGIHAVIHSTIVRSLRDEIPFGPAILSGTAVGVLATI